MKPDWKTALITLQDTRFFDLMRNYLGDIRSPYNKQKIVEDLVAWLSREDHIKDMVDCLDESDRRVISAIHELKDPSAEGLGIYLSMDMPFIDLYNCLINLEERLFIYRYREEGKSHISLNPVLEPALTPMLSDKSLLYQSRLLDDHDSSTPNTTILTPLMLAAMASWLDGKSDIYKLDGELKKKIKDHLEELFPSCNVKDLFDILFKWKIIIEHQGYYQIDSTALQGMETLDTQDILCYMTASLIEIYPPTTYPFTQSVSKSRNYQYKLARGIKNLLSRMDPKHAYPPQTIQRMISKTATETANPVFEEILSRFSFPAEELIKVCARCGLITLLDDGYCVLNKEFACTDNTPNAKAGTERVVSIDATFSLLAHHELDLKNAIEIACFLDIKETGTVLRWELTRDGAVRGFNRNLTPHIIKETLERLSGHPLPQNIRWSLDDWYKRYQSIAIHRGIVVVLSEDRRMLMNTPEIQALIKKELAPGVVLMDCNDEEEALAALNRAGADIIAQPQRTKTPRFKDPRLGLFQNLDISREAMPALSSSTICSSDNDSDRKERTQEIKNKLILALNKKNLPKDQHEELLGRIERRVIIDESQLVGSSLRYEKREARGLDYVGKTQIIERAKAGNIPIEVHWIDGEGTHHSMLGTCSYTRGADIINIQPIPFGAQMLIPLRKISLVRLIKRSIFED